MAFGLEKLGIGGKKDEIPNPKLESKETIEDREINQVKEGKLTEEDGKVVDEVLSQFRKDAKGVEAGMEVGDFDYLFGLEPRLQREVLLRCFHNGGLFKDTPISYGAYKDRDDDFLGKVAEKGSFLISDKSLVKKFFGETKPKLGSCLLKNLTVKEQEEVSDYVIRRCSGYSLAGFLEKLDDLDYLDKKMVMERFFDGGKGWAVVRFLDKFPRVNKKEIFYRLLTPDLDKFETDETKTNFQSVIEELGKFGDLSPEDYRFLAYRALKFKHDGYHSTPTDYLIKNFRSFKGVNGVDIATKAMEKSAKFAEVLVKNIDQFNEKDRRDIALAMIEKSQFIPLIVELRKFSGLEDRDYQLLVDKVLENGNANDLPHLSDFTFESNWAERKLISANEVAKKMMDKGYFYSLLMGGCNILNELSEGDRRVFLDRVLLEGGKVSIQLLSKAYKLFEFTDPTDFTIRVIKAGERLELENYGDLVDVLVRNEVIDKKKVAKALLDVGGVNAILEYIGFFGVLDKEVFASAISKGGAVEIVKDFPRYRDSFDMPRDVMVKELLSNVELSCFFSHISNFSEADFRLVDDDYHFSKYFRDIGVNSFKIYNEYRQIADMKDPVKLTGFSERINGLKSRLVTSQEISKEISDDVYYREVVSKVYPNNSGDRWTNFESNESCADRSSDLKSYKIKPVYKINLAEGVDLKLKDGTERNGRLLMDIEEPIRKVQEEFAAVGFEKEKMRSILDKKLDELVKGTNLGGKEGVFASREEKLFGLALESLVGRFNPDSLKEVMISYQFSEYEDIRAYIEGTRERTSQAKNQDYAYLLELNEFFEDKIKEVQRSVVEAAFKNPAIQKLLPEYYEEKAEIEAEKRRGDEANKLRLDTIGLRGNILHRVLRELDKKTAKDSNYHLVEIDNEGNPILDEQGNLIPGKKSQAIAGMIFSEQRRAADAIKTLSGKPINPADINLGDLNLEEYLAVDRAEIQYDQELFSRYLTVAFQSVFSKEISLIREEVGKYEEVGGSKERKIKSLEGYITKNKPSAHARQVGGVCVAGDNPSRGKKNMWDMPNYFQMVLKDPENGECKGLVLLHSFEENGKKILAASFNPSSTYLYAVNERQMFKQLLSKLVEFAKDNDFDMIAVSKNTTIRTNRTGGEFEREISDTINRVGLKYEFDEEKDFSYSPAYKLKDLDAIWVNK